MDGPRHALEELARQGGRRFWRGLDELLDDPAMRDWLAAEYPSALGGGIARRDLLRAMAASLAMASLAGCAPTPETPAVPYVNQPADYVPGLPRRFATAVPFDGYAQPVLAECHAGRPTRLDGNPRHPMSGSAVAAFTQAAVLELYDPDRSQAVTQRGRITTWGAFDAALLQESGRLKASGGEGLRLLTGPLSSPTALAQIDALRRLYPGMRWHGHQVVGGGRGAGTAAAFGRPLMVWPRLDAAHVVVSLEDDLLGPGPFQVAMGRAWAEQRRRGEGRPMLFVAESTPSLTGAMAYRRLAVASARIPLLAAALPDGRADGLSDAEKGWLGSLRNAIKANPGGVVVSAGAHQPPEVQAWCMNLSHRLGEAGRTVSLTEPVVPEPDGSLADLVAEMKAGRVQVLLMLDVNPLYTGAGALDFAQALAQVPFSVHAAGRYDETASMSQWHLPLAHPLESWSDARAVDGSVTILQPLIAPLRQGRSMHQILAGLLGRMGGDMVGPVRDNWRSRMDDAAWRRALHDGVVAGSALPEVTVSPRLTEAPKVQPPAGGTEIVFRADPGVWDGRFANCAWLQELPKPLDKVVWDNVVALSPAKAQELNARPGDLVEVELAGRRLRGPAWPLPGQATATVTLFFGYGRQRGGMLAEGRGYDPYPLLPAEARAWSEGQLRRVDGHSHLVTTQLHHAVDGGDLVRIVQPREGVDDAAETTVGHPDRPTLYPRRPPGPEAWGMVIDVDLCIGCNACVVACQAENNVPSVGKDQVAVGREMHWLRVDRYYEGSLDHPFTHFQPVPCMHCENAPCELGCPVTATLHGPDGINEMVYNRCIGTRTCATYCPYKVRRFNFYDFAGQAPPLQQAQRNPEVSVRARGVMEKCTYCIQRVAQARIDADRDQRAIRDGEVRTACQNACPTGAIVFGNLSDDASEVARQRADRRNYGLLDELNTWPRTTYLARIRPRGTGAG